MKGESMQVQFNRPATIAGETYGKGTHAVPDAAKSDWFFGALVADGSLVILREDTAAIDAAAEAQAKADADAKADALSASEAEASRAKELAVEAALDLLDGPAKGVISVLEDAQMTHEQLTVVREHEAAGKNRSSVLAAIDAAVEALGA